MQKKPLSIGKKTGGFLFASASDRSLNIDGKQQDDPQSSVFFPEKTDDLDNTKNMSLAGTLKERLSQYKALKEEEQRNYTLAATPQPDPPSPNTESEKEKPDESWVPNVKESNTDVDHDGENIITEESEQSSETTITDAGQEEYEEEEIVENEVTDEGGFAEEDDDVEEEASFEEVVDMESSDVFQVLDAPHTNDENQDVFQALDEAERADNMLYSEGSRGSNRESLGNAAPQMISSQGERNDRTANDGFSETSKNRRCKLHCIVLAVVIIACIAIVAIVLPFFLDYGSIKTKSDPTPSPVPISPTPLLPTGDGSPQPMTSPTDAPTASTPTQEPTTLQWSQFMKTFLIPTSGEEVFQDKNSPQYRAAKYILEDPYTSELTTTEQLDDRYASVTFYFSTEGENWDSCYLGDTICTSGEWLVNDVCDWFAVSCNEYGRVSSFSFANAEGNGLVGTLPLEMYLLSDMSDLVIVNNTITGTLPQAFGNNATQLRSLLLPDNELTGTIPNNYLESSPLEFVHLGSNLFSGPIPSNVGNTTYLQQLDLSGNSLTGNIPDTISGYKALEALSFANNMLVGSIPEEIYSSLANLKFLHLNGNKLSGTVASLIGELLSLKELRIGDSNLGGMLPDELYALTNLAELDISQAQFEGRLSLGLLNLGALEKLIVNDNKLNGTVPASFGSMSTLSDLVLQGNELSGSMPDSICLLREDNLEVLTADCEKLTCDCCSTCF